MSRNMTVYWEERQACFHSTIHQQMKNETNQSSWIRSVNPFFPKLTLAAVTDECIRKVKRYIIPLRNNRIWFQVIHLRTDCKVYNMMADNESEATGCLVISSTSVCIKYCTILLLLVFWWWMLMSTAFDRHAVLLKSATASKSLVWRIFSTFISNKDAHRFDQLTKSAYLHSELCERKQKAGRLPHTHLSLLFKQSSCKLFCVGCILVLAKGHKGSEHLLGVFTKQIHLLLLRRAWVM